jgi:hypothetical protein
MNKLLLTLAAIAATFSVSAQNTYWQQHVKYNIDVQLNDTGKSVSGFETVVYTNHSPDALSFIWFHIWPNAYQNDQTALFRQLKSDAERKKKLEQYSYGWIKGLEFKVDGKKATTQPHSDPRNIDIIKVMLHEPLKPGASVTITTPFNVKLPEYFSRSGVADGEFMVCQWYPKPAVYDKNGWHEFPYLDMGEFYSEYGDYIVNITLPSGYVVGATGELKTNTERERYQQIGKVNAYPRSTQPQMYTPLGNAATKTLRYEATQVPDFAWFADKKYVIQYDTVQLASGRIIDAYTYSYAKDTTPWEESIAFVEDAVRSYSSWVGEYKYPVVQAVEGPKNNSSGGMEYPMITLITSPNAKKESLDGVIAHEVGHNWFMSMLGSNEREHTWMDEGLNTYFQFRYEAEKYKSNMLFGDMIPKELREKPRNEFLGIIFNALNSIPMDAPIETPADKFATSDEYGLVSYMKTALWMHLFELTVGEENADKAIKNYFAKWNTKHPQPEDMKAAFEEASGKNLDKFFSLLRKKGSLTGR